MKKQILLIQLIIGIFLIAACKKNEVPTNEIKESTCKAISSTNLLTGDKKTFRYDNQGRIYEFETNSATNNKIYLTKITYSENKAIAMAADSSHETIFYLNKNGLPDSIHKFYYSLIPIRKKIATYKTYKEYNELNQLIKYISKTNNNPDIDLNFTINYEWKDGNNVKITVTDSDGEKKIRTISYSQELNKGVLPTYLEDFFNGAISKNLPHQVFFHDGDIGTYSHKLDASGLVAEMYYSTESGITISSGFTWECK